MENCNKEVINFQYDPLTSSHFSSAIDWGNSISQWKTVLMARDEARDAVTMFFFWPYVFISVYNMFWALSGFIND